MQGFILLLTCILILVPNTIDACNFPSDFTGTWKHSQHGSITFSGTTVMQMTETIYGTVSLNCNTEVTSGSKYIVVSDAFNDLSSNSVKMKICMEFTKLKDYLYKVIHRTAENSKSSYERVRITAASDSDNSEGTVCDDNTSETDSEYYLMMKDGEISNVKTDFPSAVQGKLSYTFDSSSCSGNTGSADICIDKTLFDADYTACSTVVGYTSTGHLNCIYYTSSGSTYTIWTYNQDTSVDNSATYYFTCFKAEVTGTTVVTLSATQNPYFCDSTQTATAVSTGSTTLGKPITGTTQGASTIGTSVMTCGAFIFVCNLIQNWL